MKKNKLKEIIIFLLKWKLRNKLCIETHFLSILKELFNAL